MEFEVGMYVRTKWGILKIDKLLYGVMEDAKKHLHFGNFKKASHNIIDLIEVGDYVNGEKVGYIDDCEGAMKQFYYESENPNEDCGHWFEEIKSIVTKEQFESMEYKVGE
jgi:hypothetical protein